MDIFVEEPTLSEEINSWLICYDLNISPKEDRLCRYHYHDYIEILYGLDCGDKGTVLLAPFVI